MISFYKSMLNHKNHPIRIQSQSQSQSQIQSQPWKKIGTNTSSILL